MTSVERDYGNTQLEQEESENKSSLQTTDLDWPSKGEIYFSDVSMSYRKDGVFAIKNTSFHVKGGEKVIKNK